MDTRTNIGAAVGQPRTSRLTWRRKLAYTALCVLLVLLAGEVAVRVRAWLRYGSAVTSVNDSMSIKDEATGLMVPRPGAEQQGSKIHIKINSLGFRGADFSREKPPHTIRIACVGASTTFCSEVSDDSATWAAQLQSLLQAKYPDVHIEVINAGIPGYVIAESLQNLEHRVLPLQPDLVIYYEANNDMAWDSRSLAQDRGLIAEGAQYRSPFSKFMSEHSLLYDLVNKNLTVLLNRGDVQAKKLSELPPNLPDRFAGKLSEMHDLLSERQIPMVLSTFLAKYRRDQPRATQISNADVAFYYMPWMSIETLLDGLDLYNEAIIRLAHSKQIPVVEDRTSIPADDEHFADFVHLRDAGCTLMAERFANYFDEHDTLRPIIARLAQQKQPGGNR